jgi:RNA polymerase sigma factor (sigma-70 family)
VPPAGVFSLDAPASGSSTTLAYLIKFDLGAPAAWEALEGRYRARVAGWCRQAGVGNSADLQDAVQEAWVKIVRGINSFDRSRGSFQAWCSEVSRNAARDLLKAAGRRARASGDDRAQAQLERAEGREDDPAEAVVRQLDPDYEWVLVQEALAQVSRRCDPKTVEAFRRTALGGEEDAAVGADLGMTLHAVQQARSRTLARLKLEALRLSKDGPDRRESVT